MGHALRICLPKTINMWLRGIARATAVAVSVVILSGALFARTEQVIAKVDGIQPASWQMGADENVVLRLSGKHLDEVVGVKVKHKGVRVVHMQSQDSNHLLVTLHVSQNAEPGTVMLQVFTRFLTTFAALPMETGIALPASGNLAASN
jgi:hypothetical protein